MKDIKCPLCGRSLQFFPDLHEIAMGRIGCPNCDWTTLLGFEETVWEEAEKIVSKTCMVMQIVTILPTSKNGRGNSNRKEGNHEIPL